jgi:sterol desaturase/sphingolipid hydroxylase (fatty acid hydroxylase superfamily)
VQTGGWIWAVVLVACFALLALIEALAPGPARSGGDTRLLVNFSLGTINIALGSALPVSTLAAAALARATGTGLGHVVALPWGALFVLTLLARSFVTYWVHRLSHSVPLLWRLHRVHHGDRAVDVSTTLRNHPIELALTIPAAAGTVLLLGPPISVVLAVDTLLFALALWQHADIRTPAEPLLGSLLVTPGLHRAHHSPRRTDHDRNFGDVMILWDHLFGTYAVPVDRDSAVGLEEAMPGPERLVGRVARGFRRR